jgi:hypothetical protein
VELDVFLAMLRKVSDGDIPETAGVIAGNSMVLVEMPNLVLALDNTDIAGIKNTLQIVDQWRDADGVTTILPQTLQDAVMTQLDSIVKANGKGQKVGEDVMTMWWIIFMISIGAANELQPHSMTVAEAIQWLMPQKIDDRRN